MSTPGRPGRLCTYIQTSNLVFLSQNSYFEVKSSRVNQQFNKNDGAQKTHSSQLSQLQNKYFATLEEFGGYNPSLQPSINPIQSSWLKGQIFQKTFFSLRTKWLFFLERQKASETGQQLKHPRLLRQQKHDPGNFP